MYVPTPAVNMPKSNPPTKKKTSDFEKEKKLAIQDPNIVPPTMHTTTNHPMPIN